MVTTNTASSTNLTKVAISITRNHLPGFGSIGRLGLIHRAFPRSPGSSSGLPLPTIDAAEFYSVSGPERSLRV